MTQTDNEQGLSDLELVLTRDLAPHLRKIGAFGPGVHEFKSQESDGLSCRVEYTNPVADLPDKLRLEVSLWLPECATRYSANQIGRTLMILGEWAKRELGVNSCPYVGYSISWTFKGAEAAEVLSHLQKLSEVAA